MRIKEIITELFNQSTVPFKWTKQDDNNGVYVAVFTVGEIPYLFSAFRLETVQPGEWDVKFGIHSKYAKENSLNSYGITGTGNAGVVMSTVVSILKEFLAQNISNINVLKFSAAEESRRKLYARMVQRLLPEWIIEQKGKYFTVTRPEVVEV